MPNPAPEGARKTDRENRRLAQRAQTDTELESIVPPTSGRRYWRGLAVAAGVLAVLIALAFAAP